MISLICKSETNTQKEVRFMVAIGRGQEVEELDEGDQKVQPSSYKTNKYWV